MKAAIVERPMESARVVVHGAYADGCVTRLSTQALPNVTAGGGSSVPSVVVEKR